LFEGKPMLNQSRAAVIFDLDDTLLVSRTIKWEQYRTAASRFYGFELGDDELALHWGKPFDEMIRELFRCSAPVEELIAAVGSLDTHYPKTPCAGAVHVVDRLLRDGVLVGVVTSSNTEPAMHDLARTGFPVDHMLFVHGADTTAAHKPDPAVFDESVALLAEQGVTPDDVTYVGDSLIDLHAARGAGLRFVGVTTGVVGGAEFRAAHADSVPALAQLTSGRLRSAPR
jgi:phosphoglycolate phosphatase-like HAD superfamily hydrolase